MKAAEIIYTELSTTAAITALVSTRIYPEVIPEEIALPAISFDCESGDALSGSITMAPVTVRTAAWGPTRPAARAVGIVLHAALGNFTGSTGTDWIKGIIRSNYDESYDEDFDAWGIIQVYSGWVIEE